MQCSCTAEHFGANSTCLTRRGRPESFVQCECLDLWNTIQSEGKISPGTYKRNGHLLILYVTILASIYNVNHFGRIAPNYSSYCYTHEDKSRRVYSQVKIQILFIHKWLFSVYTDVGSPTQHSTGKPSSFRLKTKSTMYNAFRYSYI